MVEKAERKILDMVEQGQISADEGLRLINAMQGSQTPDADNPSTFESDSGTLPEDEGETSASHSIPEEERDRMKRMKRWWVVPFAVGLLMTIIGAIWMYSGYLAKGFGAGFWLSWIPFLLGVAIVAISFPTSRSLWLHVRIKQKPGASPQRISISLPMPIRFARWFFSTFGEKIPNLKDQPVEEISAILETLSPEEPFYVHVDDKDGEEVEVFIG